MQPAKQKELFDKFFEIAVCEYSFSSGSVYYQPSWNDFVPTSSHHEYEEAIVDHIDNFFQTNIESRDEFQEYFKKVLNVNQAQPAFSNLSKEQFDICLNELIKMPNRTGAVVEASYTIKAWKIAGERVSTYSTLIIHYGANSLITTMFQFNDISEFEYLKQVFQELGICKLNPKHLKKR